MTTENKVLSKQAILDSCDTKTKQIHIAEWGGDVIISTMSGFARDRFESSVVGKAGGMNTTNIRAKLVAACVVDEKGELLFTEADVIKLGNKSCTALDKIFAEAQKLNHLGADEIEELAKN